MKFNVSRFRKDSFEIINYACLPISIYAILYSLFTVITDETKTIVLARPYHDKDSSHSFVWLAISIFIFIIYVYPKLNWFRGLIVTLGISSLHEFLWTLFYMSEGRFLRSWVDSYSAKIMFIYLLILISLFLFSHRKVFDYRLWFMGIGIWLIFMVLWKSIGLPITLSWSIESDMSITIEGWRNSLEVNMIECTSWVIWLGVNLMAYVQGVKEKNKK